LKIVEHIGIAGGARELSLYESQLYAWRKKQQQACIDLSVNCSSSLELPSLSAISLRSWPFPTGATYFEKRLK
jgi:transposase